MLWRDTKFIKITRQFCNFAVLNLLMDFKKSHNKFCQKQGIVSRKFWYCEMNVGTYRGTQTLFLCIFALSMQVAAFLSLNLSRFLARKKLWGVSILFNMISTKNWILICQFKWFKNVMFIANLAFWVSSGPMVW